MIKYWKYHLILALTLIVLDVLESYFFQGNNGIFKSFLPRKISLRSTFFLTSIIIYILNYKYVCPFILRKKQFFKILFWLIILILTFGVIRFVLEEIILFQITGKNNYNMENLTPLRYLSDNYFYAIKPILYSTIIFFVINNKEKQEHAYQLQLAKSKAELDVLKSQISPHFLFNTLNTFYVELIDEKPETADDIQRLSELLRHVIYVSKGDFITLEKEIKFLKDYVHFFEKRYEDNLFLNFNIEGSFLGKKTPTLILINFIENLFKHGIVNDKNNVAEINLKIEEKFMILKTRNRKNNTDKLMHSGIGIKNVQKRLEILFPDNEYHLNFLEDNNYFEATLKLPV